MTAWFLVRDTRAFYAASARKRKSMPMPMVRVRHMRMVVNERGVTMPVAMCRANHQYRHRFRTPLESLNVTLSAQSLSSLALSESGVGSGSPAAGRSNVPAL